MVWMVVDKVVAFLQLSGNGYPKLSLPHFVHMQDPLKQFRQFRNDMLLTFVVGWHACCGCIHDDIAQETVSRLPIRVPSQTSYTSGLLPLHVLSLRVKLC